MSDTLEVKKERVLAVAGKCADAKRILQELFPEAFSPAIQVGELVYRDGDKNQLRIYLGCDAAAHRFAEGRLGIKLGNDDHVFAVPDPGTKGLTWMNGGLNWYSREAK